MKVRNKKNGTHINMNAVWIKKNNQFLLAVTV